MAVRKEAFEAVGGFNEELPCLEDHNLTVKLSKLGRFIFINDLTVYESMRRIRKWGILKTLGIWTLNFLNYVTTRRTYSRVWAPVR